jgi:hypothetical protein
MNTYDDYNADVVIIPATWPVGDYEAWWGRDKLATGTAKAMRLIATGAFEEEASVYDVESHCFLNGGWGAPA